VICKVFVGLANVVLRMLFVILSCSQDLLLSSPKLFLCSLIFLPFLDVYVPSLASLRVV